MGETPIYDQVRRERIHVDVPASGADPHRAGYHGKHRMRPDTPVPAVVFGPSGPGDGLAPNYHRREGTYPADRPAADRQQAGTVWGPRATLPPEAHTRQTPRHATSSPPASAADRNPAAQDAAAGDRGAHCAKDGGIRQVQHTEPSLATSTRVRFSWFSAGPTPVTSER
jgi:hypothetical protein